MFGCQSGLILTKFKLTPGLQKQKPPVTILIHKKNYQRKKLRSQGEDLFHDVHEKNNLFEEKKHKQKKTFQHFGSISTFEIRAGIASG